MNERRYRSLLTTSAGFLLSALLFCALSPAAALSKRHMELLACTEQSQRLLEEAEKSRIRYLQTLAAQPKAAPWQRKTCDSLRSAIAASQRRIDWQGQGSRACTERYRSPMMLQMRADLQDSNDRRRQALQNHCS